MLCGNLEEMSILGAKIWLCLSSFGGSRSGSYSSGNVAAGSGTVAACCWLLPSGVGLGLCCSAGNSIESHMYAACLMSHIHIYPSFGSKSALDACCSAEGRLAIIHTGDILDCAHRAAADEMIASCGIQQMFEGILGHSVLLQSQLCAHSTFTILRQHRCTMQCRVILRFPMACGGDNGAAQCAAY